MTIKSKVFAAAATMALIGSLGAAGATAASAATPSCGPNCLDLFSKNFGTFSNPQFIGDVFRQGQKTGQPVILFRTSNSDPAEDWTIGNEGQVSDFYAAGLVSSGLALHYGCNGTIPVSGVQIPCAPTGAVDDYAFEAEYAPYGVDSGLCAGVGVTAGQNTPVSLQPCGASSKTVWVVDTLDSCPNNALYSDEVPLINGSDTNFSHPYVLTYPSAKYPTDIPRPELTTTSLTGFSQTGGTGSSAVCGGSAVVGPDNNQLWSADEGIVP